MLFGLALLLAWLAPALGLVHAAPARPRYEPPAPPALQAALVIDLRDTVWQGKYNLTPRTFVFEADGTVSYRTGAAKVKGAKAIKNRGTWRVEGNKIFFEHWINPANKIMEFRGTITDANTITGEAVYPSLGKKDTQTLQRSALDGK